MPKYAVHRAHKSDRKIYHIGQPDLSLADAEDLEETWTEDYPDDIVFITGPKTAREMNLNEPCQGIRLGENVPTKDTP